jgi:hypothetical protein
MDPYSQPARKKLIEGSRGILQGKYSYPKHWVHESIWK